MADSQDAVWKEAFQTYFPESMAFFFPIIHSDIDWDREVEFLDKELLQLLPDDEQVKQITDLLVRVHRLNGEESYFLIHLEIQGYFQENFAERMFYYNIRLMLRYKQPIASLVVYTDNKPDFRPNHYEVRYWNFYHEFGFPIAKMLDYGRDWERLETDPNPFAVLVLAQLKMHELRGKDKIEELASWKLRVLRLLLQRGLERAEIVKLLRFIGTLMRLPAAREEQFRQEVRAVLEEVKMPLLSVFEEIAMDQGREKGLQEGLQEGLQTAVVLLLETRFGALEPQMAQTLATLSPEQLKALLKAQTAFNSKDEVTAWLNK